MRLCGGVARDWWMYQKMPIRGSLGYVCVRDAIRGRPFNSDVLPRFCKIECGGHLGMVVPAGSAVRLCPSAPLCNLLGFISLISNLVHKSLPNSLKATCCHCGVRNFALDAHLRESASQSANKPHVWVWGRKGFRKNYVTENQKYVVRCLSRVWLKTRKEDFHFYACTTLDSNLKSMSLLDIIYQLLQFT